MKKIIAISLILTCMLSICAFAFPEMESTSNTNNFSGLSESEVGYEEDFYIILNLSKIDFTKFRVDITNTSKLPAENLTTENVSELATNSVATNFIVDKNQINLSKIGVCYTSGKIDEEVEFTIKLTSLDDTIESLTNEVNILTTEIQNINDNITTLTTQKDALISDYNDLVTAGGEIPEETTLNYEASKKSYEDSISQFEAELAEKTALKDKKQNRILNFAEETLEEKLTLVVSKESSSKDNQFNNSVFGDEMSMENMMKQKEENEKMTQDMEKLKEKMGTLESDLQLASDTISSLSKSTTYQGSQNNYLSTLVVKGIDFDSSFNKTKSDYFISAKAGTKSLTVTATAEDSSAIVTVYGNTSLEAGMNKIIVTVTADNGSTRVYRIYCTVAEE